MSKTYRKNKTRDRDAIRNKKSEQDRRSRKNKEKIRKELNRYEGYTGKNSNR